jgi:sugar phosphate isomerase/epimerase
MKLGITTNVFAGPLRNREIELKGIIDLAPKFGMKAVEIRDDAASLDEVRVESLVSMARTNGLVLTYGIKNDMSLPEDRGVFERGVRLASLCGRDTVLRVLASQDSLKAEGKTGYSAAELERFISIAEKYGGLASASSVLVAIEHAREPLYRAGRFFGMSDLMSGIKTKSVGLTFDPANSTTKSLCRSPSTESEVLKFLEEFGSRIFITHFKTTRNGAVSAAISDADVDNQRLLESLSKVYRGILCIEIPGAPTLNETMANLQASIDYIRLRGLSKYLEQ